MKENNQDNFNILIQNERHFVTSCRSDWLNQLRRINHSFLKVMGVINVETMQKKSVVLTEKKSNN